ncbi:HAD family hydrolase [Streptomyces sparsus]
MRNAHVLIFDADDTLWENNVIFERVIDRFLDWVCPPSERDHVRPLLDRIEASNAVSLGYGANMFRQSLRDCRKELLGRALSTDDTDRIEELVTPLLHRTIELISGVPETLAELSSRYELLMLTKGDLAEQQRKVEASQLAHHFRSIHIVGEKNVDTYRGLVGELGVTPSETWMIGNSPKSDIIPARRAGLNTVHIPHEHTWVLEHQEFGDDEATLALQAFPELLKHF